MIVVVSVFGRPETLRLALPALRDRAGIPIELRLVVAGDLTVGWHHVSENQSIGEQYADSTLVVGSHIGNGEAIQLGIGQDSGPYVKADADVIPNQNWLKSLVFFADLWNTDGKLGCLLGIPTEGSKKTNVGPRRYHSGRRLFMHLALFTKAGAEAVREQTTDVPINGHDILIAKRLHEAGLWQAYCHAAYTEQHLQGTDSVFDGWKKQYLNRTFGSVS